MADDPVVIVISTQVTVIATKKADVAERPEAFNHVGLLTNEPPAQASCSSFSHPTTSSRAFYGNELKMQGGAINR